MWCMRLKIGMGDEHQGYSKHSKFHQNLRGTLQFLVDLAWNDPYGLVYVPLFDLLVSSGISCLLESMERISQIKKGKNDPEH